MPNNICRKLPFGRFLAILAKTYYAALTKKLEPLGIEKHYSVLIFIEGYPLHCSQQLLCNELKIDKVSMVRIIDELIEKKFVKRVPHPDDRRAHDVVLMPKAVKLLPQIHEAIHEVNKFALKSLTKKEQEILYNQLSHIHQNLELPPAEKIYINYKKASQSK